MEKQQSSEQGDASHENDSTLTSAPSTTTGTGTPADEATPSESIIKPVPKNVTPCGVCDIGQSKYKCPRCYLPYCSVVCNRKHKEDHPPDTESTVATKPTVLALPIKTKTPSSDPSNPFCALDTSDELQHLFRRYPGLVQQLLDIYAATQPPAEAGQKKIPASLMQGVAKRETWNHDLGIKRGKEALRRARQADGEAGDAMREYSELVLHLINNQKDEDLASTLLRQQAAQEDSKLVEQLLIREKR